jgi:hypothetical protein
MILSKGECMDEILLFGPDISKMAHHIAAVQSENGWMNSSHIVWKAGTSGMALQSSDLVSLNMYPKAKVCSMKVHNMKYV